MRTTMSTLVLTLAVMGLTACQAPAGDSHPAEPASTPPPVAADTATPAPAPEAAPGADGKVVNQPYACDGKAVTADFLIDKEAVRLQFDGRTLTLPQAISGSGSRYADTEGNEFWEHQGEATLTVAGGKPQTCTEVARAGG